jgi:hypothetical protein
MVVVPFPAVASSAHLASSEAVDVLGLPSMHEVAVAYQRVQGNWDSDFV